MADYQPHPLRFQLKRVKGFRMPDGGVSVARPSKWGNPYKIGDPHPTTGEPMTAGEAVELFRSIKSTGLNRVQLMFALMGRPLGCYCPLDKPCHADVLAELANPVSVGPQRAAPKSLRAVVAESKQAANAPAPEAAR